MAGPLNPANFPFRMEGDFNDTLYLLGARIDEGINHLTKTLIEFCCTDREVDIEALLGSDIRIIEGRHEQHERTFFGRCVSVEFLDAAQGVARYRAELRPVMWFLSRSKDCRIFQDKTTVEIVTEILGEYGISGDLDMQVANDGPTREYTVQYRETDLDFITRLMEEEGFYYYFDSQGSTEKVVVADTPGAHPSLDWCNPLPYRAFDEGGSLMGEYAFSWRSGLAAKTGKISLTDYNFEKPSAKTTASSSVPAGDYSGNDHEVYDYPGHFREVADGETRARVRMEAEAVRHHQASGAANAPGLFVGQTFALEDHPREIENREWMIIRATHLMRLTDSNMAPPGASGLFDDTLGLGAQGNDPYRVMFDVVPSEMQYRAALTTPWPEVGGVHTALVTGPKGEEIHTDQYGRIKVQFHWDRLGKKDEKSSCWVRCMMPWTGKGWGMMAVPRMGQEVVVQFEEGDPDRPLVVGMLYNKETMPPWALPANKTQSGVKTRSSKDGSDALFNELRFEDKKDAEEIYFHAERDYTQVVENDADISVGEGHKDKGDMKLTVHRNLTETVKTGNHAFTVSSGNQTIKVKKDLTETVEGKYTETITKDTAREVKMGNVTDDVKKGNYTQTLDLGNHKTEVKLGNHETKLGVGNVTVKTGAGKITMEALQSIELKVGGSSIKIDPMGVTIKGAMTAKMEGGLAAEVKGGVKADVKGGAMVMIKGAITMIN